MLSAHLPEAIVQAVAEMVNRGLATEGIACLLLGTMSPGGEWACRLRVSEHAGCSGGFRV